MQLSPADLALIKSQPQEFNLFLNIYQPETVFAAQVGGNISQGARDIPFDNVTIGDASAVQNNFILMVGTTPGGNQRGTIRVRYPSPTGTYLIVAENSHIEWSSGQYLTVLNYIDIDAIYPRIIQNPSSPEDVIFYKDYDIPYTNQNTILGSFICMGPHRAAFRDPATGLAQLFWSSSGTYNVNGDSLTYAWEFEGATVTGSTSATPGYRTYDHTGDFRTRLTVTSSEGAVDKSYRWVSIRDRPGESTPAGGEPFPNDVPPLLKWEINSLQGSRAEGGYTGRVKIWEPVDDINYIKDGALVVIFSDDFYAGTRRNLGGNAENCSDIFFVGYILKGSITYDYKEGSVEFDLGSVTEMMKMSQGFSVSCQDDAAPDTWFKIKEMTVPKALYHYLRWHSTVLLTTDFQHTDDDRAVQYFDSDRESLYDAVAKFIETGIKGEIVCDRQGKLWSELSAAATSLARTAFPSALSITKNDWGSNPPSNADANAARAIGASTNPTIMERVFPELSYLEYGGILYHGTASGTSDALLACFPGSTPSYKGGITQEEGLILTSQFKLNALVGNEFAYQNSRFPELSISMVGAYKNLDIAPVEMVQMNMAASDTPRGITFNNEPFHITAVEWEYRPASKSLIQTPHLAQLVNGISGESIVVPPIPDDGFSNPKEPKVPPISPFPTPVQPVYGIYAHEGVGFGPDEWANSSKNMMEAAGVTITSDVEGNVTNTGHIEMAPGVGGIYDISVAVYWAYAGSEGPVEVFTTLHVGPHSDIFADQQMFAGQYKGMTSPAYQADSPFAEREPTSIWVGKLRLNAGDTVKLTCSMTLDPWGTPHSDIDHATIAFSIFRVAP